MQRRMLQTCCLLQVMSLTCVAAAPGIGMHMLRIYHKPCAAAGAVLEMGVPDHRFHVASAFNDMSLHLFSAAKLAEAAELWE